MGRSIIPQDSLFQAIEKRPDHITYLPTYPPIYLPTHLPTYLPPSHKDSLFHTTILRHMHACAIEKDTCHFPSPEATLANQRRDQSSLNAILCALQSR